MFARITRLMFLSRLLAFQISLLGLKVWARETAYHAITRFSFSAGLALRAVDLDDDDVKAAIQAAVDEAVSGLKTKNAELQGKLKKAQKNTDIDPAEVEKLESELESLRGQLNDANKQLKTANTTAEKAAKDLAAEQAHTQRLLINDGLTQALTAAGVKDPMHLKAAAALLRDEYKPAVAIDGENRVAMVGDKKLGDFIKEWAGSDEGKSFVAAPVNAGGGATGGKGGTGVVNPFAKETQNLTAAGQLFKENPTLARSLAAEAGVKLD